MVTDIDVGEVRLLPDQLVGIHSKDAGQILAAHGGIAYCEKCAKTWTLALKVVLTGGR